MRESFLNSCLFTIQKMAIRRKVKIFLVGGAIRDALLHKESLDLDFAVERSAISFAENFSHDIKGAFVLLDKEHGCARVVRKHRGQIYTFDFADFRAASFKKDLLLRDFTINTLAVNMAHWDEKGMMRKIVDRVSGKRDLTAGIIRMVSDTAFEQDPLRLLRAFSLRAILGFSIDHATRSQIKKDVGLIRNVSAERIRDELFKIFESDRAAGVLKEMDHAGLLEQVMPQIRVMVGVKQGTYHHLDVWPHALETVKQFEGLLKSYLSDDEVFRYLHQPIAGKRSRKALLKLACLLHDVGKPETRRRLGERICFHGHEHAGRLIVYAVAKQLKLSTKERHILGDMVELHLRPGYLSNLKRPSQKAVFRYFRDAKDEAVSVALLARADQRATRGPMTTKEDADHHDTICLNLIARYFEMKKERPFDPLINGDDLIQILGLKPSPLFSKILKEVEEAQVLGKICTVDQALAMAKTIAAGACSSLFKEKNEGLSDRC